jgi:crotonobetainyl-CoA:carnitine CoA-transferase CaiB-like acyl-CoA transferase
MNGALNGIRVLDLSRILAGPWATQLLGDYGADVVKIEIPGAGDDTRAWGPPWLEGSGGRESAYFLSANRNKRSVTIDLKSADGQALVRELAAKADVLVENFRAGATRTWGLDAESLLAANPRLVYCTISAFGSDSSKSREPGYDAMIQASAGLMSITGPAAAEGGQPQKVGVAIADIMCGMYAATAILAALHDRTNSGKGQAIEIPLFDSQVAWLANQNMNFLVGGDVPGRLGTAHPNIVPYQAFPTADGHIMIAVGNDRQFRACAKCLDLPQLATDERFLHNEDRLENRDTLVGLMTQALARRETGDWIARLTAREIPCSPINDIAQVFDNEYSRERELVRRLEHPFDDRLPTVANPVRFSQSTVDYRRAPPLLGEHTNEVLGDWLSYSHEAIEQLREAGTI